MKIRRLLSILAAIVMVLSLMAVAGCGDKPTTGANGGNAVMNNKEEEFFLDMPSELEGTTVKFATWIDHSQTDTADVLAGFEQTTGMKYEWVNVPQGEYITKLIGLIAADQAPDVIVENGDFPNTLELLMPLEVETTGLDVKDPFWDQKLNEIFTFGGKTYLVNGANSTWNMAGGVTYYNRTILEENGLETPGTLMEADNWNLDSLKKLVGQCEARTGLEGPAISIDSTIFLAMYGAAETSIDPATGKFVNGINTPKAQEALRWLLELSDAHSIHLAITSSHSSFSKGTSALQICGAYGLRNKPGWFYDMDLDDLGFAPLPKLSKEDADYPWVASTRSYGICAGSKNPKGAAYFLRYFLNGDNYDYDKVFKNEEAKNLYIQNREKIDYATANFNRGVQMTLYPDEGGIEDGVLGDIIWSDVAQFTTNLEKSKNKVDACVAKGNELIDKKIEADK